MTGLLEDGVYDVPVGKLAAVVTSLQMWQPPPGSGVEAPGLGFRPVPRPDPAWYRTMFRRVGAPWLWTARLRLAEADLISILHHPSVAVFAIDRDGAETGLVELDFRAGGDAEITYFGLVPEATGQGIGRWAMDRAVEHAWARPIGRLWIHTCTLDHPAALAFYRRCGFVPFRRQVEIMDDPRALGLLPSDAAPDAPRL